MNSEGAFSRPGESNRSVRMENVGEADVVNPWLSNGRSNFRNVAEIVRSAITPDMNRRGEGLGHLVPADPPPPPLVGREQRIVRRGPSPQRSTASTRAATIPSASPPSGSRRDSRWRPPGLSGIASPRSSTTAPGISSTATCTASIFCATNETGGQRRGRIARDHDPGQAHALQRNPAGGHAMGRPGTAPLYFTESEITGDRSGRARHHDEHGPAPRRGRSCGGWGSGSR